MLTLLLALAGGYCWWLGTGLAPLAFVLSALMLVVTVARPAWLNAMNRAWMKLGAALHRLTSPIVLGVLFFGLFAPVGVAMRAARRDALKRRFDPGATTYWVDRDPPGPEADSLPNQF